MHIKYYVYIYIYIYIYIYTIDIDMYRPCPQYRIEPNAR